MTWALVFILGWLAGAIGTVYYIFRWRGFQKRGFVKGGLVKAQLTPRSACQCGPTAHTFEIRSYRCLRCGSDRPGPGPNHAFMEGE